MRKHLPGHLSEPRSRKATLFPLAFQHRTTWTRPPEEFHHLSFSDTRPELSGAAQTMYQERTAAEILQEQSSTWHVFSKQNSYPAKRYAQDIKEKAGEGCMDPTPCREAMVLLNHSRQQHIPSGRPLLSCSPEMEG